MTIDSRFICSSDVDSYYNDKLTGLPLSAGIVKFYSDVDKTTPKAVYQLTGDGQGTPYAFSTIGNQVTLNSVGSYAYLGNNIALYYLPFFCDTNGDPSTATTEQELYYVTVENSGNQPQFTRNEWPPLAVNIGPGTNSSDGIKNYIPNGQFLSHNDHPISDTTTESGVTIKQVAQGGWSFKTNTAGTGSYTLSFNNETNAPGGELLDFPSFSVNISSPGTGSNTVRDLVIQWPDVNKFSKNLGAGETNIFNLLFAARLNSGVSATFDLRLIRNFGSGGSTSTDTSITTFPVTATYSYFNENISIPDNSSATVGEGSFIALVIRVPPGVAFDVRFTDFAFTLGNASLLQFPVMTNDEMLSRGVAGWMPTPNPDGSDMYLPLVLTNQGMTFDHSIVGQIIGKTQDSALAVNNELFMDGSTYLYSGYSSLGIPYSRLADYLIANSPGLTITNGASNSTIPAQKIPMYGTGPNFVTILQNNDATKFDLSFNTASGGNAASNGTTVFTHTSADPLYVYTVVGVPTASQYFSFTVATGGSKVYNVWFTVDGIGSAPTAPTGANIAVALITGDTVASTILKILTAVNKYQFMVMNAQGYFWRGMDITATVDPNANTRTILGIGDNGNLATGAHLGSLEQDAYIAHTHLATSTTTLTNGSAGASNSTSYASGTAAGSVYSQGQLLTTTTVASAGGSPAGGLETRPKNMALNWFIKY